VPWSTAFGLRNQARDGVQPGAFAHVWRDALEDVFICRACAVPGILPGRSSPGSAKADAHPYPSKLAVWAEAEAGESCPYDTREFGLGGGIRAATQTRAHRRAYAKRERASMMSVEGLGGPAINGHLTAVWSYDVRSPSSVRPWRIMSAWGTCRAHDPVKGSQERESPDRGGLGS
jgi:hypothetical protein